MGYVSTYVTAYSPSGSRRINGSSAYSGEPPFASLAYAPSMLSAIIEPLEALPYSLMTLSASSSFIPPLMTITGASWE